MKKWAEIEKEITMEYGNAGHVQPLSMSGMCIGRVRSSANLRKNLRQTNLVQLLLSVFMPTK